MLPPEAPALAQIPLTQLALTVEPIVELKPLIAAQEAKHPAEQAATNVVAALIAVLPKDRYCAAMVRKQRVKPRFPISKGPQKTSLT